MEMCTSLICIDACNDYTMSGRIYHSCIWEGVGFGSFMELVELQETIFNSLDYPQSCMELRSFGKKSGTDERIDIQSRYSVGKDTERGRIATFNVRVMFRQNASWHGSVQWLEEQKTENFRSVLELLHLMSSTVPEEQKTPVRKERPLAKEA